MSEMALELIRKAKAEGAKFLDLGNCGIVGALPDEVGELEELEELYLSSKWWEWHDTWGTWKSSENLSEPNVIVSFPSIMPKTLRRLYTFGQDVFDISSLANCKDLEVLDISKTKVKDISVLGTLKKLKWLNLSHTFVSDLSTICQLPKLQELLANGLKGINFDLLANLTHLKVLFLSDTEFSDLGHVKGLKNLLRLGIERTKISDLSGLKDLPRLEELKFTSEIIQYPPIRILGLGFNAIVDYLIRAEKETEAKLEFRNWQLKLVVVGNNAAGKSSLIQSWIDEKVVHVKDSTHWLGIQSWTPKEVIKVERVKNTRSTDLGIFEGKVGIHVFDFGGQDFYHDAHHLFFTSDTAYLVLWDNRTNNIGETTDSSGRSQIHYPLRYWLDAIRYHCQLWDDQVGSSDSEVNLGSPIDQENKETIESLSPPLIGLELPIQALILQTHLDETGLILLPADKIKTDFPWVFDFDGVGLSGDYPPRLRITKDKLLEMFCKNGILGAPFSATWSWVSDAISDFKGKPQFTISGFRAWANKVIDNRGKKEELSPVTIKTLHFTEREINSLLKYLCSLGLILHYSKSASLKNVIFMLPQQIREQVLDVLNGLKDGSGYFDLQYVGEQLKKKKNNTDPSQLLSLMQQFKMVFELQETTSTNSRWVAPQYLQTTPPSGVKMLIDVFDRPVRRIAYPNFIHKSVILELFQAYSQDLLAQDNSTPEAQRYVVWRDGMVISIKDSPELVLVKFFIGQAEPALEAHIEVYSFKTPHKDKPADFVLRKLREINTYWYTREEVTVDGATFIPLDKLQQVSKDNETHFIHDGKTYALEDFAEYVEIPWQRIFVSYAEEDEAFYKKLDAHMSNLKRGQKIALWSRGKLVAGMEKDSVIQHELHRADIVVLLLSAEYFGNVEVWENEMKKALATAKANKCKIAYLKVRECDMDASEVEGYEPLLNEVVADPGNDVAWTTAVRRLREMILEKKGGLR